VRTATAVAALLVCSPALADVYNVTITMPAVSGAAQCKPYLNGVAIPGGNKACGSPIAYPGLFPTEGTYAIACSGVSAAGLEGGRSPATTAVTILPPATPGAGPTITITCPPGWTTTAPTTAGIYEFRLFADDGYNLLARSVSVRVQQ
jgi:hypothetical protein